MPCVTYCESDVYIKVIQYPPDEYFDCFEEEEEDVEPFDDDCFVTSYCENLTFSNSARDQNDNIMVIPGYKLWPKETWQLSAVTQAGIPNGSMNTYIRIAIGKNEDTNVWSIVEFSQWYNTYVRLGRILPANNIVTITEITPPILLVSNTSPALPLAAHINQNASITLNNLVNFISPPGSTFPSFSRPLNIIGNWRLVQPDAINVNPFVFFF